MSSTFDHLDRSSGDGSTDEQEDWMDSHSRIQENKWTTSQTTFWPNSHDGNGNKLPEHKRRKFMNLRKTHDRYSSEKEKHDRKTTIRYGHILNDIETFCNICHLDEYQIDEIKQIVKQSDISSNEYGGKRYEKIILALMTLVVDRDINREEHFDQRLILQDEFTRLMDNNDLGSGELRRIRQMIRERMTISK